MARFARCRLVSLAASLVVALVVPACAGRSAVDDNTNATSDAGTSGEGEGASEGEGSEGEGSEGEGSEGEGSVGEGSEGEGSEGEGSEGEGEGEGAGGEGEGAGGEGEGGEGEGAGDGEGAAGEGEGAGGEGEGAGGEGEGEGPPRCGDGIVQPPEACDDGNDLDGDYCSSDCTQITGACGDGIVQANERCDPSDRTIEPCSADCTKRVPACGLVDTRPIAAAFAVPYELSAVAPLCGGWVAGVSSSGLILMNGISGAMTAVSPLALAPNESATSVGGAATVDLARGLVFVSSGSRMHVFDIDTLTDAPIDHVTGTAVLIGDGRFFAGEGTSPVLVDGNVVTPMFFSGTALQYLADKELLYVAEYPNVVSMHFDPSTNTVDHVALTSCGFGGFPDFLISHDAQHSVCATVVNGDGTLQDRAPPALTNVLGTWSQLAPESIAFGPTDKLLWGVYASQLSIHDVATHTVLLAKRANQVAPTAALCDFSGGMMAPLEGVTPPAALAVWTCNGGGQATVLPFQRP